MKIIVTAQDIKKGMPCSPGRCPIARAVARALPEKYVSVTNEAIYCLSLSAHDLGIKEYQLPTEAKEFINRLDNGETVKPFILSIGD